MKKTILIALILSVGAVAAWFALAPKRPPDVLLGACAEGAAQFCAGKEGDVFKECMADHYPQQTQECQAQMIKRAEEKGGCAPDRMRYCGTLMTGTVDALQGNLLACYLENFDKLTPACQKKVSTLEPCVDDINKLCGAVSAGDGRVTQCLEEKYQEHPASVSAQCVASLKLAEGGNSGDAGSQ